MVHLSELEEHILSRLASTRSTASTALLIADLQVPDERISNPFTVDMVFWILKYLNKLGLIVYRVHRDTDVMPMDDDEFPKEQPVDIRVTDLGYTTLGYTIRHQIVDQAHLGRRRGDSIRPGDPTDFRNQRFYAPYEPCERMSLAEHQERYSDHIHPLEWWATTGGRVMTQIDEVIRKEARAEELSREIATAKNLRLLALQALAEPCKDIGELRARLGHDYNNTEVTGVLWSLKKQDLVTFVERGREVRRIKLTPKGHQVIGTKIESNLPKVKAQTIHPVGKDYTEPKYHGPRANGGPIERAYVEPYRDPEEAPMPAQNEKVETDLSKIPPYFVPGYTNVHASTAFRFVQGLAQLGRPSTVTEAAKTMGVGGPTVIQQAKAAAHWGWVEPLARDGNRKPFRITELGREVLRANPPKTPAPVIDEGSVAVPDAEITSASPEVTRKDDPGDTHTQYPLDSYPLIAELMTKESRLRSYEAAAELLLADDEEMAQMLLEKIQLTDLEKEVIRFVRALPAH